MSIVATITDNWSDGKRDNVVGSLAFAGNYTLGGVAVDFGAAGVQATQPPVWLNVLQSLGYFFTYVPGTGSSDGKLQVLGGTGDAAATGVLTSNNTNVSNGNTVTIGTRTYTFKTTLTGAIDEVKIGADADSSLTSLAKAINLTGVVATDYNASQTINTDVSSGAVASHTITVTALVPGTAGNAIATTKVAATLSWGGATLSGGVNGTPTSNELSAAAFPADLVAAGAKFHAIFLQLI